jgi:hypothetical protein
MQDAPMDFQEVNVEIKEIQVNYLDSGWVVLGTGAGVYDLLKLQDEVTAPLVEGQDIPVGKMNKMRLILGSNNTVMVDSVYSPLATTSAENTGLKMKTDTKIKADQEYEILFDFDAEKSVDIQGNGSYSLKPSLKTLSVLEL